MHGLFYVQKTEDTYFDGEKIIQQLQQIQQHANPDLVKMLLLTNVDNKRKQLPRLSKLDWFKKLHSSFDGVLETSAKSGFGVPTYLQKMVDLVIKKHCLDWIDESISSSDEDVLEKLEQSRLKESVNSAVNSLPKRKEPEPVKAQNKNIKVTKQDNRQ